MRLKKNSRTHLTLLNRTAFNSTLHSSTEQNVHQSESELKVGEFVKSQGKKRYATLPSVIYALFIYGFEISSLITAANLIDLKGIDYVF